MTFETPLIPRKPTYHHDEYKVLQPVKLKNTDFEVILDRSTETWFEPDTSSPLSIVYPLHKDILLENTNIEVEKLENEKITISWRPDWKNHDKILLNYFQSLYVSKLKLKDNETILKYYEIAVEFKDVRDGC